MIWVGRWCAADIFFWPISVTAHYGSCSSHAITKICKSGQQYCGGFRADVKTWNEAGKLFSRAHICNNTIHLSGLNSRWRFGYYSCNSCSFFFANIVEKWNPWQKATVSPLQPLICMRYDFWCHILRVVSWILAKKNCYTWGDVKCQEKVLGKKGDV